MNEKSVTSTRMSTEDRVVLSDSYISEHEECVQLFSQWSELEQVNFVEKLLAKMCHSQLGQVDCFLRPMLQRDFISALPGIHTDTDDIIESFCPSNHKKAVDLYYVLTV